MPLLRPTPWLKLTATGIPQFRVARRPIHSAGVLTEIGEFVPPQIMLNKLRLRQLYEAGLIVPDGQGITPAYQIPAQQSVQAARPIASASASVLASVPASAPGYIPPHKRK